MEAQALWLLYGEYSHYKDYSTSRKLSSFVSSFLGILAFVCNFFSKIKASKSLDVTLKGIFLNKIPIKSNFHIFILAFKFKVIAC